MRYFLKIIYDFVNSNFDIVLLVNHVSTFCLVIIIIFIYSDQINFRFHGYSKAK